MVRAGKKGFLFDDFKNLKLVAIEWKLGDLSGKSLDEIKQIMKKKYPKENSQTIAFFSGQVNRFVSKFEIDDFVITFNPENRIYLVGKITSDYYYSDKLAKLHDYDGDYCQCRDVEWIGEVNKDDLKSKTINHLNYSAAVFEIDSSVKKELLKKMNNEEDEDDDGIGDSGIKTVKYWLISAGYGSIWWNQFLKDNVVGIGMSGTGDLRQYDSKKEIKVKFQRRDHDRSSHVNDVHACWQFVHDMQIGDIIFVKNGTSEIIGRGIIESEYEYDTKRPFHNIRKVNWTHKGKWNYKKGNLITKTLTEITNYSDLVKRLIDIVDDGGIVKPIYPIYTKQNFLEEVYIDENEYITITNLLKNKKNLIIEGAPGVGKTFMAKRLAYSIMGEKDISRVMMVQFHQSYSYEDFVMGYRPSEDGFELRHGSFYQFCKTAEEDSENDYFFIIDEINRGNLSKIFGELFMLIENDKRGEKNKIQLLYSDESFFIPKNVFIIGLMNTADRSLAMIDYALRRRFAFFDLKPGFDSIGFKSYQVLLKDSKFNNLIEVMNELNQEIKNDESLGEGFRIGHSYLCNIKPEKVNEKLNYVVEYELIPLLKEYWFDEPINVDYWSEKLRSVLNDS